MATGKIILSCGHEDLRKPLGWPIFFSEESFWKIGQQSILGATFCTSCAAARMLTDPETVWFSYEEAREAVHGQT